MKRVFIILFISVICKCNAQITVDDIKKTLSRNILAYHIKYSLNHELDLNSDGYLVKKNSYKFDELIPLGDYELDLVVKPCLDLRYPVSNIKLYEANKRGFRFENKKDSESKVFTMGSFDSDDRYLLGVDETTNCIKFLSGNMFLHQIQSDFEFSNTDSYIAFINIKLFNLDLNDIRYIKCKKNKLIFEAYSNSEKVFKVIMVNKCNKQIMVSELNKRVVY